MKYKCLIAAPTSGSGKTTIARGLMALYAMKGYGVQPFKCGPDYIDTKFHEAVCHRPSINLDTFMASPEHVVRLFDMYGADADISIVEGMMGLFDGYDRDRGSSAEIAQVLGIPVILVVDAKSAAYSMAPLLSGFMHFREGVDIRGVIFNRVGSLRHQQMLRQVCDDLDIPCLGCLPKDESLEHGTRYLGLDFSETAETRKLVALIEKHVDWKALLSICEFAESKHVAGRGLASLQRVVVARNAESFSFLYNEHLDCFGDVTFFDPEKDVPDLSAADLLYLPGGYPEKHLEALVKASATREAVRTYAENGGRILAECGGMMYLCDKILADDGEYPMCGVLPFNISARKSDRKLSLGYRQFVVGDKAYKGHEFHYTQFSGNFPHTAIQVLNAKGEPVDTPVMRHKNVIASYTHLYWAETGIRQLFDEL